MCVLHHNQCTLENMAQDWPHVRLRDFQEHFNQGQGAIVSGHVLIS